jgi:two-component system cell cycle sensor histidine kinase/response regulator CckA
VKRLGGLLRRGTAARLTARGDPALESLFQALPPTLLVGPDGEMLRANRAAGLLFPDAKPGLACESLFAPPARAALAVAVRAALAGTASSTGLATPLSVLASPLTDPDGTVCAVLVQFSPAGAAGVPMEQLAAGQRLQTLGQLVGGIAHDFNNLLTIISAAAEAAAAFPQTAVAEAARIHEATSRGADLARRLLAFGRQQTLQPRGVDANAAVRAAANLLDRLMGESIHVTLALEESGRAVHVDPTQLDQVLINLAVNARDAMPCGGRLTLATGHTTLLRALAAMPEPVPAGRWITIEIADTGDGIAPDILPRIFEPYFTTRTMQPGSTGGTGLGLATVHGILRQSGGYLTVQTAQGAGTTMTVYLPRWDGVVDVAPSTAVPTHASGDGRAVLLVEDEHLIRTVAERALTRRGWLVLSADSGEEALELLTPLAPPLAAIVSDMVMPGMDGAALVRAARARTGIADLPAILVSGYAAEHQRKAMAGLDAVFMAKPYAMQELADRLAAIARPPRSERS